LLFIEKIAWACVVSGALMLIGGAVLAVVESFLDRRISQGMSNLGQIASALTKKNAKDAQQPLTALAQALHATAETFTEYVRGSRGRAKSTLAFRLVLGRSRSRGCGSHCHIEESTQSIYLDRVQYHDWDYDCDYNKDVQILEWSGDVASRASGRRLLQTSGSTWFGLVRPSKRTVRAELRQSGTVSLQALPYCYYL
jgi:hypothetical protein